jgi:hypothetical protein
MPAIADLDRMLAPLLNARATFRGMELVAHRNTATTGRMVWALPGRGMASTEELAAIDPYFTTTCALDPKALKKMHTMCKRKGFRL